VRGFVHAVDFADALSTRLQRRNIEEVGEVYRCHRGTRERHEAAISLGDIVHVKAVVSPGFNWLVHLQLLNLDEALITDRAGIGVSLQLGFEVPGGIRVLHKPAELICRHHKHICVF